MFVQQGRKVFKEVVPMVSEMILDHAAELSLDPHGLKRLWLHQANINMNTLIGRKVLGREPEPGENVIILDDYANTSSAGSIIAFHLHNDGFRPGDTGLICSFGAGYSAGTVFVQSGPDSANQESLFPAALALFGKILQTVTRRETGG